MYNMHRFGLHLLRQACNVYGRMYYYITVTMTVAAQPLDHGWIRMCLLLNGL